MCGELQLIDWVTVNSFKRPIRALLLQQPYGGVSSFSVQ